MHIKYIEMHQNIKVHQKSKTLYYATKVHQNTYKFMKTATISLFSYTSHPTAPLDVFWFILGIFCNKKHKNESNYCYW